MADIRKLMRSFWEAQACRLAEVFPEGVSEEEVPEILALLPDLTDRNVLELGAGRGRFTQFLSEKSAHVTSVDFEVKFLDEIRAKNSRSNNITYICQDVTELHMPSNCVDVIFCNWLFMYLSDEEVHALLTKALTWFRPGGVFFFRESCFHQSGNESDRAFNPTVYRKPADYMALVESAVLTDETAAPDGDIPASTGAVGYQLVMSRSVQAYSKHLSNNNQLCWLVTKVPVAPQPHGCTSFKQFLDTKQYSRNGILRYEKIFGKHFVSTGGLDTTKEFVSLLDLQPDQQVLDVGAGIGGSAFYMAAEYDVTVLAIDLSSNMVNIGLERANEIQDHRVQFEIADATQREFAAASFDVIYSRDTILHIADKRALFAAFFRWLRPGGKVLISDYCCGPEPHTAAFRAYVTQRGYHLLTPQAYGKVLETVGFTKVRAEDRTAQFKDVLTHETDKARSMKHEFIEEFSESDYHAIVEGWSDKILRVATGDQRWGLFYAEKPI